MLRSFILLLLAIGIASAIADFQTPLALGTSTVCGVYETAIVSDTDTETWLTNTIPLAYATNIPGEVCVELTYNEMGDPFTSVL